MLSARPPGAWMNRLLVVLSLLLPCVLHAQGSLTDKLSWEQLTFPGDQWDYGSARVVGD